MRNAPFCEVIYQREFWSYMSMVPSPNHPCARLAELFVKMRHSKPQAGDLTLIEQHLLVAKQLGMLLESAANEHGLTLTQLRVLVCVYRLQQRSDLAIGPVKVGAETGYSKAHASEALTALVGMKFVRRAPLAPGDRRMVHLMLTERGGKLATRIVQAMLPVELHIRWRMRVGARSTHLTLLASYLDEQLAVAV